jgi:hypothetical protein
MLGKPEAAIAKPLGMLRQLEGTMERLGSGRAGGDWREIEY